MQVHQLSCAEREGLQLQVNHLQMQVTSLHMQNRKLSSKVNELSLELSEAAERELLQKVTSHHYGSVHRYCIPHFVRLLLI
jgi:chromosome segregation ATPase